MHMYGLGVILHTNVLRCVFDLVQCIRDVGVVNVVLDSGDVQVRYHNNSLFTFNTQVLAKVHEQSCV